jgi:LCP family protein required for cell wall assembly
VTRIGLARIARLARWVPLLAAVALVIPASSVQPSTISLTSVGSAKAVEFDDGVLWVLVLGSDARPGTPVTEGNTDAIQLVGLNWRRGSAVSIGIPRDSWVSLEGPDPGFARINSALGQGGTGVAAQAVTDLVGITPDLVLVTGFAGFVDMLESVGEIRVDSPVAFPDNVHGLVVRRGTNRFDAEQALSFARIRQGLEGDDLARSANHQRLMVGVLEQLRLHEDEDGFMEAATLAAIGGLETDLDPLELYRFAQAVTLIDPSRTTACVIGGSPYTTEGGAQVLLPDTEQSLALGDDAEDDATLQGGCRDR